MSAATPAVNAAAKAAAQAVTASTQAAAGASAAAASFLSSPPTLTRSPKMVPNPATLYRTMMPSEPLPEFAKLPPAPRIYRKRARLHPYWKLHPVRKWKDFAPFVTKAVFTYDPATEGSVGIRELFRHANSENCRNAFPKCKVERHIHEDGREGSVVITWSNGKSQTVNAQWKDFEDILDMFEGTRQALQWLEEDKEMQ